MDCSANESAASRAREKDLGDMAMAMVSVICTARNAAATIAQTIESIIAQTLTDWEMIIVDDGSVDSTLAVARRYGVRDPRIVTLATGGIGRGAALNRALQTARTGYVANIDADDLSHPQRLELQVATLRQAAGFHVLGTRHVSFRDDAPQWPLTSYEERVWPPHDVTRELLSYNPILHSSVMLRREAILAIGGYDARRKRQFDYDLWVRLALAGYQIGEIRAVLAAHRIHARQSYERERRLQYLLGSMEVQYRVICGLRASPRYWAIPLGRVVYGLLPQRLRCARSRRLVAPAGRQHANESQR